MGQQLMNRCRKESVNQRMSVCVQFPDVDGVEVEVVQKRLELLGISLPGAADHIHQMHADGILRRVHPGGEPVEKAPTLILDMLL